MKTGKGGNWLTTEVWGLPRYVWVCGALLAVIVLLRGVLYD